MRAPARGTGNFQSPDKDTKPLAPQAGDVQLGQGQR